MGTEYEEQVKRYLGQTIEPYQQPCLDSSVFCGGLNDEIENYVKRKEVFDWLWLNALDGKYQIWISAITIVEVHKLRRRKGNDLKTIRGPLYEEFLQKIDEGLEGKFIKIMDVGQQTAEAAHTLCCTLDISPNDAIILASSLDWKCDVLLTWDTPLVGKTHDKIRIEEPFIYERNMFNGTVEIATEKEQQDYDRARGKIAAAGAQPIATDLRGSVGSDGNGKAAESGQAIESEEAPIQEVPEEVKRPEA